MHLLCDSRGIKSLHVTLAVPSIILVTAWFILGGLDFTIAGLHIRTATKSAADYAIFIAPWLAALGFRDWNRNGNHTS